MIKHYLKSAFRNLVKYKIQNAISIASMAIGMVALAIVHVWIQRYQRPPVYDEPYYERMYRLILDSAESGKRAFVAPEAMLALRNGGPFKSVDGNLVFDYSYSIGAYQTEVHMADGSRFRFASPNNMVASDPSFYIVPSDPEFTDLYDFESAATGQRIGPLKEGEAIIGAADAKGMFGSASPIGASLNFEVSGQSFSATIVDIYNDSFMQDFHFETRRLYWCVGSQYANSSIIGMQSPDWGIIHLALLREGFSREQMEAEFQAAVAPLGLQARLERCKDTDMGSEYRIIRPFGYLLGAMILISAVIGFLKMQVQLFQMRKREIALRMVSGARRGQVLSQLVVELSLPVIATVLLAVVIGFWFNDFVSSRFPDVINGGGCDFESLYIHSISLGIALMAVSAAIAYIAIQCVCRSRQGMVASMRRSRSHVFRNIMLWIQVFVSMFLSGLAAMFIWLITVEMDKSNIPDGHEPICSSFDVTIWGIDSEVQKRLERIAGTELIPRKATTDKLSDFSSDPAVLDRLSASLHSYVQRSISSSMSFLNLKALDVKWINREAAGQRCYFLSDTLYSLLFNAGAIQGNCLSIGGCEPAPVAGTYRATYYSPNSSCSIIEISSGDSERYFGYILAASADNVSDVEDALRDIKESSNGGISYDRREEASLDYAKNVRLLCWILAAVSLIICSMGIFSTISLDTKTRSKEMAIRKINGAKKSDIARIFCRLYLIISATASVFAWLPTRMLVLQGDSDLSRMPPVFAILVVIATIALIVGIQVWRVMRVNPSEIIAKE